MVKQISNLILQVDYTLISKEQLANKNQQSNCIFSLAYKKDMLDQYLCTWISLLILITSKKQKKSCTYWILTLARMIHGAPQISMEAS